MDWEIVVGIETHAQLLTRSKIFSGASTAFGAAPNTQAAALDIALPGTLPVLNRQAVELAIRFGLAIGGIINRRSIFARKNYFYPDLPKGYQISQYELPIVQGGELNIEGKKIRITRAHLEEDAGKSLHEDFHGMSGIDLNRAGTPLLEIVSEPDLRGAKEAVAYAKTLHSLVTWIGICDGNMQEGSFRCDANVSVRKAGSGILGTRSEIKNLNSFRFMEQAIEFEARRQIALLEDGGKVEQETRLYDPDRNETRSMRTKEDAQDYRYFPDPDLLPLVVTEDQIERIKRNLPELPDQMAHRLQSEYGISPQTASLLTSDISRGKFFDGAAKLAMAVGPLTGAERRDVVRDIANATVGELTARLNDKGLNFPELPFSAGDWMQLRLRVFRQEISRNSAKEVLDAMLAGEGAADQIIDRRGLRQVSNAAAIEKVVDDVLAANAKQVADFKSGKEKAFQSLVGQVMKATKGKANPAQVNEILRRKLAG